MEITAIANRLILLCKERKFVAAYQELFSKDAISIDPVAGSEPVAGLKKLIDRENAFLANIELHEIVLSDALCSGDFFSVIISMHFTPKNGSSRKVTELAVYKVENSKIVSQQFFIDKPAD